ncbi:sterol desaturase family protein [Pseudoalteromonas fenneropenaei]|uniref:Sterol desaturase family protein n=1 Tax=Pseudoalteromonas fenneropenaei TaxID=1737459 RepID=A0ABV7CC21_9GAMM
MPSAELILLALSPVFLCCIVLEFCLARRFYRYQDSATNTALALLHQAADGLALLLLMPYFSLLHQSAWFVIPFNGWTLCLAFILQDFLYYWFHRASHRIHWFWAAHAVHHSSKWMNLTTAFRQSVMYPVAGMWLFWTPMMLLGYPPQLVFTVVALNLAFQFFVHTQTVKRLGWLEHIFNTPSHHRVHHGKNPCYLDKNFAGVLIIWDKLFGTFQHELADTPVEFGIVGKAPSNNPLACNFSPWYWLFKQYRAASGYKAKLNVLFGPPNHEPE